MDVGRTVAGIVILVIVAAVVIMHIYIGIQERKEYGSDDQQDEF